MTKTNNKITKKVIQNINKYYNSVNKIALITLNSILY